MHENRRPAFATQAIGKSHVIGMRVREKDGNDILYGTPEARDPSFECAVVSGKTRIDERQSPCLLDDIPIEWAGIEVIDGPAVCQRVALHDITLLQSPAKPAGVMDEALAGAADCLYAPIYR